MGRRRSRRGWQRYGRSLGLGLGLLLCIFNLWGGAGRSPAQSPAATDRTPSAYDLAIAAPYNRPETYPVAQAVNPAWYKPTANWVGRLILPTQAEHEASLTPTASLPSDWVWIELLQAPAAYAEWVGQRVRLTWQLTPERQTYLDLVTRDLAFTAATRDSQALGRLHPTRLDGWPQVGPLVSLAGARSQDDVIVALDQVQVVERPVVAPTAIAPGTPDLALSRTLTLGTVPTQIAERWVGLVQIERPVAAGADQTRDRFVVQHYNPASGEFDGGAEIVWIPQVAPDAEGRLQSTVQDLSQSPAGGAGWYIYGAYDQAGEFIVRSLLPRSLLWLQPETTLTDPVTAANYINFGNWRDTPARQGTVQTVWLPGESPATPADAPATESAWQAGDRALLVHLFGGVGGAQAEPKSVPGTVTGHFSYGLATVQRDPFTQALIWAVQYDQVYAHNPNGIISGQVDASEYLGHLQRGWLGLRPVSDALVQFAPLFTTYQFGEVEIAPVEVLQAQLHIMMARYRTGDGTGGAIVTPAISCVQDSSQAVYETIQMLTHQISDRPEVATWLAAHPDDPQTQQWQELLALGAALRRELVPVGIVRPDWAHNTNHLIGIGDGMVKQQDSLVTQLLSWRTVMPRVAYDQILNIFWRQGAALYFLRTNQVGGWNPQIAPLAPTELLGQYVVIPTLFSRLFESLRLPTLEDWLLTVGFGLSYLAIALPLGLGRGALTYTSPRKDLGLSPRRQRRIVLDLAIVPAFVMELGFRVLLLPAPTEGVRPLTLLIWIGLSLVAFVLCPVLDALSHPPKRIQVWHPVFLMLVALFGLTSTALYQQTGSLWTIAVLHWVIVSIWTLWFGGWAAPRQLAIARS